MHTHTCTPPTHVHIPPHVHTTYTNAHLYTHAHTHTHAHPHSLTSMHTCTHMHTPIQICTQMHTHTCAHTVSKIAKEGGRPAGPSRGVEALISWTTEREQSNSLLRESTKLSRVRAVPTGQPPRTLSPTFYWDLIRKCVQLCAWPLARAGAGHVYLLVFFSKLLCHCCLLTSHLPPAASPEALISPCLVLTFFLLNITNPSFLEKKKLWAEALLPT